MYRDQGLIDELELLIKHVEKSIKDIKEQPKDR